MVHDNPLTTDDIPIVHDIDYNEADYIENIQDNPQDLNDINFAGKDPSERIHKHPPIKSFGDAYEKLVANNDDMLWHSFFG